MKLRLPSFSQAARAASILLLVAGAVAAPAQTTRRALAPRAQPAAPATAATLGTPSASGLPSNSPFPAGLPTVTTPNLSAGAPATASTASSGTMTTTTATAGEGIVVPNTAVAGGPGVPAGRRTPGAGSSGYAAVDIAASFLGADLNHDGELTRAEAARLTIMPYSFEEMDANHDGIITRFEYEDAVR